MSKLDELDHPCKETCSGWRQGFMKGEKTGDAVVAKLQAENASLLDDRAKFHEVSEYARWKLRNDHEALDVIDAILYQGFQWSKSFNTERDQPPKGWIPPGTKEPK